MATPLDRSASLKIPRLRGNWLLAVMAVLALGVSAGFWYWNSLSTEHPLTINSGVELIYRPALIPVLCEEAAENGLKLEIQKGGGTKESIIGRVNRGELDAAVVPAGLAITGENVRQVAMLECETLHLFVKPEYLAEGIAGLKGLRINLGPEGSGVRIIAGDILNFAGLKAGKDYVDESRSFAELPKLPPEQMPDAVFGLSPLPSPLGVKLVERCGYRLVELPFADALALRKPYLEDVIVPANTYAVHPAVPAKPMHSVGTRSVLVAHRDVSKVAIRRLLEVLYESDFARRVGMQPLDPSLLQRSGEYPSHAGTLAYLRRHDPWVNKDLVENLKSLRGMLVSAVSALILAWQWYRRRKAEGADDYLRICNKMELNALRSASQGEFGDAELRDVQAQLVALKILVLERHQEGLFARDPQFTPLISRIEDLQKTLPTLRERRASAGGGSVAIRQSQRRAG